MHGEGGWAELERRAERDVMVVAFIAGVVVGQTVGIVAVALLRAARDR